MSPSGQFAGQPNERPLRQLGTLQSDIENESLEDEGALPKAWKHFTCGMNVCSARSSAATTEDGSPKKASASQEFPVVVNLL